MPDTSTRLLVVRPPAVPTYFNAGHHLPIFSVAAYLRRQLGGDAVVDALDASALNITWKELADRLWGGGYNVIACMNDFGEVAAVGEFIERTRALLPRARLVTFGRLSAKIPGYFERYALDGIVVSGDYESGLLTFVRWVRDPARPRPGVAALVGGGWRPPDGPGALLPVDEWALPDVSEIPYDAYDRLYARAQNRFCGLPGERELVVPVARGCPIGCGFCEIWRREGRRERRLPVARVVDYILASFDRARFDYVAMYAPTFTLQRRWVLDLCDALERCGRRIRWKCTTTLDHLDEELLTRMAASGCARVSVGVETLEPDAQATLPAAKRSGDARLGAVAAWCRRLGVELSCFVILGLPGATVEGTAATADRVRALGARLRPMFYAAYDEMDATMDEREIARFDRQLAPDHLGREEAAELYALFHAAYEPAVSA
jgi:anaerobic magnesium-protoporphyrin IX monomethyl ester cyclase